MIYRLLTGQVNRLRVGVVFARYISHQIEDFSTATNTETDVQAIDRIKQFDRSDVRVAR